MPSEHSAERLRQRIAEFPELLENGVGNVASKPSTAHSIAALSYIGLSGSLVDTLASEVLVSAARGYRTQLRVELANSEAEFQGSAPDEDVVTPGIVARHKERQAALQRVSTGKPLAKLSLSSKALKVFGANVTDFLDASDRRKEKSEQKVEGATKSDKKTDQESANRSSDDILTHASETTKTDAQLDYRLYFPKVPHFYITTHRLVSDSGILEDAHNRKMLQYVLEFERKTRKGRVRAERQVERQELELQAERERVEAELAERTSYLLKVLFAVPFGFQKLFRPVMDNIFAQKALQRLVIPVFNLYMRRAARKAALKKIISAATMLPVSRHELACYQSSQFNDYFAASKERVQRHEEDDATDPYAPKKSTDAWKAQSVLSILARDAKVPIPSQIITIANTDSPLRNNAPSMSIAYVPKGLSGSASSSRCTLVPVMRVQPQATTQQLFGRWPSHVLSKLVSHMTPHFYFAGEMIFYADAPTNEGSSDDEYDAEYQATQPDGVLISRKERAALGRGRRGTYSYRVATKPIQPPTNNNNNTTAREHSIVNTSISDGSDSDCADTIATTVRTTDYRGKRRATIVSSTGNKVPRSSSGQDNSSTVDAPRHRRRIVNEGYTSWTVTSCNLDYIVLIAAGDVIEFEAEALGRYLRRQGLLPPKGGNPEGGLDEPTPKPVPLPPVPVTYHSKGSLLGAFQALGGNAFSNSFRCETDVVAYRIPVRRFLKFMTTQPLIAPSQPNDGVFITRAQRHANEVALNSFQSYKSDTLAAVKAACRSLFIDKDAQRELRDIGRHLLRKKAMLSGQTISRRSAMGLPNELATYIDRPLAFAKANPDSVAAQVASMGLIVSTLKACHPILHFLPEYVINGMREHITRGIARAGETISNDIHEGSRLFIIRRGRASLVVSKLVPQPFPTSPQGAGRTKSLFGQAGATEQEKRPKRTSRVSLPDDVNIQSPTTVGSKPTIDFIEERTASPVAVDAKGPTVRLSFDILQQQQRSGTSIKPSAPTKAAPTTVVLEESAVAVGTLVGMDSVMVWDVANMRPPPVLTPQSAIMLAQAITFTASSNTSSSEVNRFEKRSASIAPPATVAANKLGSSTWSKLQRLDDSSSLAAATMDLPSSSKVIQGTGTALPQQISAHTAPVRCSLVADSYCEYYVLPKQSFLNVLRSYNYLAKVRSMVSLHARQCTPNSQCLLQNMSPSYQGPAIKSPVDRPLGEGMPIAGSASSNPQPSTSSLRPPPSTGGSKVLEGSGAYQLKYQEPVFNFLGGKTLLSIAGGFKIRVTLPGERIMSTGATNADDDAPAFTNDAEGDGQVPQPVRHQHSPADTTPQNNMYKQQKYLHGSTTREAVILLHGTLEQTFRVTPTLWRQSQPVRSTLSSSYGYDDSSLLTSATGAANRRSLMRYPWSFFGFSETLTEAPHAYDLTSMGSCVIATISREALLESVLVASTLSNPRHINKALKLKQMAAAHQQAAENDNEIEVNPERAMTILSALADTEDPIVFQLMERAELILLAQQQAFARLWIPQNLIFSASQQMHQQQVLQLQQQQDSFATEPPRTINSEATAPNKLLPTPSSLAIEMNAAAATIAMATTSNAHLERLTQLASKASADLPASEGMGLPLSEEQLMLQQARAKAQARAKERAEQARIAADDQADTAKRQEAAKAILISQKKKRKLTNELHGGALEGDPNDRTLIDEMAELMAGGTASPTDRPVGPATTTTNASIFDLTATTSGKKTHRLEAAMRELHYRKMKRDVHIMDVENRALVALSTQIVAASRQDGSSGRQAMEYLRPEYSIEDVTPDGGNTLSISEGPRPSKSLPAVAYYRSAEDDDDMAPQRRAPIPQLTLLARAPTIAVPQQSQILSEPLPPVAPQAETHSPRAEERRRVPHPPRATLANLFPSTFGDAPHSENAPLSREEEDPVSQAQHMLDHYKSTGPKTRTSAEADRAFLARSQATTHYKSTHHPDYQKVPPALPFGSRSYEGPARVEVPFATSSSKRATEVASTLSLLLEGGRAQIVQATRASFAEVTRRVDHDVRSSLSTEGRVRQASSYETPLSSPRHPDPPLPLPPFPPKLSSSQLASIPHRRPDVPPSPLLALDAGQRSSSARSWVSTTTLAHHSTSGHDQWAQRMQAQQRRLKGYSASASQLSALSTSSH